LDFHLGLLCVPCFSALSIHGVSQYSTEDQRNWIYGGICG
jgi:hypothetical protein